MYTFLIVLVTIIWGSTFFIIKDTVSSVNPFLIVFYRTSIAALVMLLFLFIKNRGSLANSFAIRNGAILGALLSIIYSSQTIGLKFTSSGHSAFITGSAVIFVPIFLYIIFKQKISRYDFLSGLIVLTGLFLLTYDFKTSINVGDLITLITAMTFAGHTIFAGRFVKKTEVLPMIAYQFVFAALVSLIFLLITGDASFSVSSKAFVSILYLGFIGTLFCYFVSVWAQQHVSSIEVALIFTFEPVFAATFAYFATNEVLTGKEILGAILILAGIIFYQMHKKYLRKTLWTVDNSLAAPKVVEFREP